MLCQRKKGFCFYPSFVMFSSRALFVIYTPSDSTLSLSLLLEVMTRIPKKIIVVLVISLPVHLSVSLHFSNSLSHTVYLFFPIFFLYHLSLHFLFVFIPTKIKNMPLEFKCCSAFWGEGG